jgi:hypothetical protein
MATGGRADSGELIDQDLGVHHAEFLPGEFNQIVERLVRGQALASVRPLRQRIQAARIKALEQRLAEWPFAQLLRDGPVGREKVGHIEYGDDRVEPPKEGCRLHSAFNCAELRSFDHLPRVAKLRERIERELDLATGALLDQRADLFQPLVARLCRRFQVGDLGGVFCGLPEGQVWHHACSAQRSGFQHSPSGNHEFLPILRFI